jgi:transposase
MPRAYENDLRRKFLDAYGSGKGTLAELAPLFGVSVGWAEKVSGQYRRSGQADRAEQRHGPPSRIDEAAKRCLLQALEARPDLTLAELQNLLAERRGIQLCIAQVWNVLKRMGVRLKKSHFTPRSATAKRTASAGKRLLPRFAPRRPRT